ncbi:MAG: hypothetical protein QXS66_04535 [Thermoproteota archaeon]|nr:hypothetical protein [Candidatus Brockarchaeota archaeon]
MKDYSQVLEYYSNSRVVEEIFNYGRGRWIAIEGISDKRVFVRYDRSNAPLRLQHLDDVEGFLKSFWFIKPRSFYGSVNKYSRLSEVKDLEDISNIEYSTPTWDIDNEVDRWRETIRVCRLIVDELEKEGVIKSVYLKWSGRGCHIHISEEAFSVDFLRKHHPLDIAFAIVEYIIRKVKPKLARLDASAKIENKIDLKRVFTLPLSLHRQLDYSCVCFKPDDIESFDLSWADPKNFRHKPAYTIFEKGEADELAEKALSEVGGYFKRVGLMPSPAEEKKETPELGRFQVMALLQAARCFILTGDIEKSKSFGLNRAIFYAWAKRRGVEAKPPARREAARLREKPVEEEKRVFHLGNEAAYLSDDGWLIIGNAKQTPRDYDNQIVKRISEIVPYEEAWRRALEYLKRFPQEVLLDQQKFFNQVYKPVRDSFIETVYRKETGLRKLR